MKSYYLPLILLVNIVATKKVQSQDFLEPCKVFDKSSINHTYSFFNPDLGEAWGDSICFIFEVTDQFSLSGIDEWAMKNKYRVRKTPVSVYNNDDKRLAHVIALMHKGIIGQEVEISKIFEAVKKVKEDLKISDCGIVKVKMREGHPKRALPQEGIIYCPDSK